MHLWSLGLNDLIFHHFIPFKSSVSVVFHHNSLIFDCEEMAGSTVKILFYHALSIL